MSHPLVHARARSGRSVARLAVGLLVAAGLVVLVPTGAASAAKPTTGAVSTTTNIGYAGADAGNGACLNGPSGVDPVNCNQYTSKKDVWLSGLPDSAHLGDGAYFFAIMEPGGQPDPNDGGDKNLSDDVDARSNRVFTLDGGVISYGGTHHVDDNKLQAWDFADTGNPGGVYILAVCQLPSADSTAAVKPSSCKYDAFKVKESDTTDVDDLTIVKDAAGGYTTNYSWTVDKTGVLDTKSSYSGWSWTGKYHVALDKVLGNPSDYDVTGTITVFNPNAQSISGATVTDVLSDKTVCSVTDGADVTVAPGNNTYAYTCSLSAAPQGELDNNAYVSWPDPADDTQTKMASFTFTDITFAEDAVRHDCVDIDDDMHGTLAQNVCQSDTYDYSEALYPPATGCQDVVNTATATATDDEAASWDDDATISVCAPPSAQQTGAKPLSFWKGASGLSIVNTGTSTSGICNAGKYLRSFVPFQDLAQGPTCATTKTYVGKVLTAATASGAGAKAQLKGQMLATALNTYYTKTANQTATSAIYLTSTTGGVGATTVDLGKVCLTSLCSSLTDTRSAFSNYGSRTVAQMLTLAAGKATSGGASWYSGTTSLQTKGKNAFNGVNVQGTLAP